jgi:hypothetical protein
MKNESRTVKLWMQDSNKPFEIELEVAQDDQRLREMLTEAAGSLMKTATIERKTDEHGNLSEVHIFKQPGMKGTPAISLALVANGQESVWHETLLELDAEILANPRLSAAEKKFLLHDLSQLSDDEWEPVTCSGEPVSETIIRDRGAR